MDFNGDKRRRVAGTVRCKRKRERRQVPFFGRGLESNIPHLMRINLIIVSPMRLVKIMKYRRFWMPALVVMALYLSGYAYCRSTHLLIRLGNSGHWHPEKRELGSTISYEWPCYYNTQIGPWHGDYASFPKAPWYFRAVPVIYYPLMKVESVAWLIVDIPVYFLAGGKG